MDQEFYTVRQAARLLGVKKSRLNKRIERGDVETKKQDDWLHLIPAPEVDRLRKELAA